MVTVALVTALLTAADPGASGPFEQPASNAMAMDVKRLASRILEIRSGNAIVIYNSPF
jgi:hypothetical protein